MIMIWIEWIVPKSHLLSPSSNNVSFHLLYILTNKPSRKYQILTNRLFFSYTVSISKESQKLSKKSRNSPLYTWVPLMLD